MGGSSDLGGNLDSTGAIGLTGKIMVSAIIVLFLVVVFVLFLHLYAKWFWWRSREDINSNPSSSGDSRRRRRRFVFAPGQDQGIAALHKGLDPSVLRSLPVLIFHPEDFKDGLECAVCLCELSQGDKARLLPKCNHGFHVDCIDMWFQSHSTCPLCRNPVAGAEPCSVPTGSESAETVQSADQSVAVGVYSTESPNFPTNVLFWGNQTQVRSGVLPGASFEEEEEEEGPSSQSPTSPSSSSSSSFSGSGNREDGMLVIDIPRQINSESFSAPSPSAIRCSEEEAKSPMTTRLRSLKRLLSRGDKKIVPCSTSSGDDVEQVSGRGQSSKPTSDC
ncbi:RING-H2 finger protein ATL3-like [Malania oleifera]|uniref:RING-H2 finger protein ATL3-like n=1 Tax=Malania oleifera TaxID=397392 RepID=UPI0025AEAAA4|nr:RING-H2 finger protein ATL3-like [Malania oleifera]XP_057980210.1 RING-H2 finger protein ATL3-like [Malania oleifera]